LSSAPATCSYTGGCHCGAVRFVVDAPVQAEISLCNCSICTKSGYLHLIVEKSQFRLLAGADHLTSYRFNTGVAEHLFCCVCGIKPFYVPRSHPDGYSVNARCLDDPSLASNAPRLFDGRNWEQNVGDLTRGPARGS
jgi:centromere protein V